MCIIVAQVLAKECRYSQTHRHALLTPMVQLMLRTPLQWPLFLHHITMATKTMVAQACKCYIWGFLFTITVWVIHSIRHLAFSVVCLSLEAVIVCYIIALCCALWISQSSVSALYRVTFISPCSLAGATRTAAHSPQLSSTQNRMKDSRRLAWCTLSICEH